MGIANFVYLLQSLLLSSIQQFCNQKHILTLIFYRSTKFYPLYYCNWIQWLTSLEKWYVSSVNDNLYKRQAHYGVYKYFLNICFFSFHVTVQKVLFLLKFWLPAWRRHGLVFISRYGGCGFSCSCFCSYLYTPTLSAR